MESPENDWEVIPERNSIPSYSIYKKALDKSQLDDKSYQIIRLKNGLHATIVHDPHADKAAASMDLSVGFFADPDDMPGLAHFCEHLLFMGTEKFPRENEYFEFLTRNNGSANAFTAASSTNFFFDVAVSSLRPALTRFAAFFHCPLFAAGCTSKEMNAIESEHKKNLQDDSRRILQLYKHLTREGYAWGKFGGGNKQSLTENVEREVKNRPNGYHRTVSTGRIVNEEVRRRVIEWWTKEYSARRMRLCVIGKESVDDLSSLVSSLFSVIPDREHDSLPILGDDPYGPDEKGIFVTVQTIKSFHALDISFPLSDQAPSWRYKPSNLIAHIIGHEGPHSLYSYLKDQGWANGVEAGEAQHARGVSFFEVTVYLTEKGFENYRSVILAVFRMISLIRSSPLPPVYQHEQSALSKTSFDFTEKCPPEQYAVWITEQMSQRFVPVKKTLSASQVIWDWPDEQQCKAEVRQILEGLRLEDGRVVLMARKEEYEKLGRSSVDWEQEQWFGTKYTTEKFDADFITQTRQPPDIPELKLPGENIFIPTNLHVEKHAVSEVAKRPFLIRQTDMCTVWYKKDDQFWVPRANVIIQIFSPAANQSPRDYILTKLYVSLLNDSINEFAYNASLAGLDYTLSADSLGLLLVLSGYNEKLITLAEHILDKLKKCEIKADRLDIIKQQMRHGFENFFSSPPAQQSDHYLGYLMSAQSWTVEERAQQLSDVTIEQLKAHIPKLFSAVRVRMLMMGNMYKEEAIDLAELVESVFSSSETLPEDLYDRGLILPKGSNFVFSRLLPDANEPNSALSYYMHYGRLNEPHLRVTAAILNHILLEPSFNVLRTREQLGYIVTCSGWFLSGSGDFGLNIGIQSERDPIYLESRVEAFLKEIRQVIEEMTAETFEEHKSALEEKWLQSLENLVEETNRFWAHISCGYYDFQRADINVQHLKNVTKEDVLALFMSNVHPSSDSRAKLSVHMRSQMSLAQQVSIAAAKAFQRSVSELGITIEEMKEPAPHTGPIPLVQFETWWQKAFAEAAVSSKIAEGLLRRVIGLSQQYPAEDGCKPADNARYIEDVETFRASLILSDPPKSLHDLSDLFSISHL